MNLRERLAELAHGLLLHAITQGLVALPHDAPLYAEEYCYYWADCVLALLDEVEDEEGLEKAQELGD